MLRLGEGRLTEANLTDSHETELIGYAMSQLVTARHLLTISLILEHLSEAVVDGRTGSAVPGWCEHF